MFELEGWWAGAARRPWGGWGAWLGDQGDWQALGALDLDRLVARGLPREHAARWAHAPPLRTSGHPIRLFDPSYPALLRALADAPAVLFAEGQPAVLQRRMVGVVGTRSCSTAGAQLAHQVGRTLADAGIVVVSGLARGIDAAAHRGALQVGQSVAVVGHGLATTSPSSHRGLRQEIASHGAIVTAFTDALGPDRWTFPRRNRWLAGVSEAIVVIEAPSNSGALLTAGVALELNRPIYAFPGPAGSRLHAGVHDLIRSGTATLVDSPAEIRDLLVATPASVEAPPWREALFRGEPIETVARIRGVTTLALLCELQCMEVRGEVVRLPGQRYVEGKGRG